MFLEFEHIPRKKEGEACTCALNQENISKNRYVYALFVILRVKTNLSYLCRYKDVVCYDYNRVRLTAKHDNKQGYINASHVKVICNLQFSC
jgi:protein tyrosine phosphatase